MKAMTDQSAKNEVEAKELGITNNEKNSQVNEPIIELQPATQKTKFRKDFEKAIPIEESKRRMIEHIRKYYEDKH